MNFYFKSVMNNNKNSTIIKYFPYLIAQFLQINDCSTKHFHTTRRFLLLYYLSNSSLTLFLSTLKICFCFDWWTFRHFYITLQILQSEIKILHLKYIHLPFLCTEHMRLSRINLEFCKIHARAVYGIYISRYTF